ncbi:MAG: hypothetical protein JWO15_1709 [Sphingomonadales bacterium]|nr:hypothetical protein [Sphingomonadales bacterium]
MTGNAQYQSSKSAAAYPIADVEGKCDSRADETLFNPCRCLFDGYLLIAEEREQTDLMNTIENKVRLSPDAGKIERFARSYKFGPSDRVEAFYFVPDVQRDQGFCEGAKSGGRTNGQIALVCPPPMV